MTLALLDADIIVHQAAAAFQQDYDGDVIFDAGLAFEEAEKIIADWTKKAGAGHARLCFSSSRGNFRRVVSKSYKANRVGKEKPRAFVELVDRLRKAHDWARIDGLEADDVMGIMGTSPKLPDAIVVSIDKDMLTLPAMVFNPRTMKKPQRITAPRADRYWMIQTLTGDTTDGYPGCPGVGPVNAERIVDEAGARLGDRWAAVVEAFAKKDLTEDDALTQARLARILRRTDYIKEREEVLLWHPTTPTPLSLRSVLSSPSTAAPAAASPNLPPCSRSAASSA